MKLLAFFQRFQTEVHALRVNGTNISNENAINGDNVGTEGDHESSNDEKSCFRYFYRFVTLRSRYKYIYIFLVFFVFCSF